MYWAKFIRFLLCAVGAYYPFHRTGRVIHNALTKWATASLYEALPVRCRNGIVVYAIPSEIIGRQIYLTRTFDPHLLAILEGLAQNSHVVLDVGANIGFFAIAMAAVAPHGTVHAIEPQPQLAAMIQKSATESGITNVKVYQCALSVTPGEAMLMLNAQNLGASRIVSDPSGTETSIRISLRRGDEFLESVGVLEIDLMKVDVEGHESQVLTGVESWLASHRIRTVVFEARGHGNDRAASTLLLKYGYRLFGIDKGLLAPRICCCPQPYHAPHEDFLAVRPGDIESVMLAIRKWIS